MDQKKTPKRNYIEIKWDFMFIPISKTIAVFVFIIIAGVLCSSLVAEITPGVNNLNYALIPKTKSFKYIMAYLLIILIYQFIAYNKEKMFEKEIRKEFEERFENKMIASFIENNCLGNIAVKYNDLIKNSTSLEEITNIYTNMKGCK